MEGLGGAWSLGDAARLAALQSTSDIWPAGYKANFGKNLVCGLISDVDCTMPACSLDEECGGTLHGCASAGCSGWLLWFYSYS